jgi:tetratricopeptide (TPR) repeat protein
MRIRQQLGWIILFFSLVPVCGAAESTACDPWAAKIASVQGNVEAKRGDNADWHVVALNEIYCPGDQIRVGDKSRAGIILANETLVRLDENSAIKLTAIEKDSFSLVELLKGIAHFISRVPRSLKVNTPFVNAAIEGTEFVVAIANQQTTVTVFEGTVLTQNDQGELRITNGESAVAKTDTAPSKVLLAKPRDSVQWALHFPPVTDAQEGELAEASRLLNAGRVSESEAILKTLDSAEAKALLSVIAVVNNDRDKAFALASEAVQQAPQSPAAHIALSYAWQARLDLQMALASAAEATKQAPGNAIAWARLAELQLSVGELNDALDSAQQATQLNDQLSRTQSILGYAYLVRIDIDEAKAAFEKAILLDQTDPLPRLGLGLAKIRRNELAEGRRDIEIAAMLDPNNAIIRSYLGKAYFEEKRAPLDAEQFAMAKELDPNDPTPYYYDAIRRQTENDPVGALEDINKSIALNDNRAVYRSSLQLDQDEAARSVSQARIYQDLGFEQQAVNNATDSLAIDPANHAAHRLLADAYSNRQRYEIGQASELFQSKMHQPLGFTAIQPQSAFNDLDTLSIGNSFGNSASDFTNLFTRNGAVASADFFLGNHNTRGAEAIVAGLYENLAISAAQYKYKSDGFRDNNDIEHDITNLFMQAQLTNKLSIQLEHIDRETDKGDMDLVFDPAIYDPNERTTIDSEFTRAGFKYNLMNRHSILGSVAKTDRNKITETFTTITFPITATTITTIDDQTENKTGELQYIYTGNSINIATGVTDINRDFDTFTTVRDIVPPFFDTSVTTPANFDTDYFSVYSYVNWLVNNSLELTLGASHEKFERSGQAIEETNPKLGARISLSKDTAIRLASFSIVNKPDVAIQTLEPTQVMGFNQFFADIEGSRVTQHNIGIDSALTTNLSIGASYSYREIEWPIFTAASVTFDELKEIQSQVYLNWVVSNFASISLAAIYENFENIDVNTVVTPKKLKTVSYPLRFSAFISNNLKLAITPTYVDHDYVDASLNENSDDFVVTDLSLVYKFPRRMGNLSFGVHNLFDEQFNFYNLNYTGENNEPRYIPSRSFITKLNITLQ